MSRVDPEHSNRERIILVHSAPVFYVYLVLLRF